MLTAFYILLGLVALLILTFPLLAGQLARKSGWRKLANQYRAKESRKTVVGRRLSVKTIVLGDYPYQQVARLIATKKGLHISLIWPFSMTHPSLEIPWRDFGKPQRGETVLGAVWRIPIGPTTLDLKPDDFETVRRHLRK
jgi:hypothetical protein